MGQSGGMVVDLVRKCDTFTAVFQHCKNKISLLVECVEGKNHKVMLTVFTETQ